MIPYYREVLHQRDGIIYEQNSGGHKTLVEKDGTELRLMLLSEQSFEWQTRIDLNQPNLLIARYTQIMPLALLWVPHPQLVHIVGLGGGAIPRYLLHHHPEIHIDCTEIDPDVYDIASRFFFLQAEERLKVFIGDGRKHLLNRSCENLYDIIFIDAFCGVGFTPMRLSTQEFIQICKNQLSENGVLVVNMLLAGGLIAERILTIQSLFKSVYVCEDRGALVVFATDQEKIPKKELIHRAAELEKNTYTDLACVATARLISVWTNRVGKDDCHTTTILTDNFPPESLPVPHWLLRGIGQDDLCPCGSNRKFKRCHGEKFFLKS